MVSTRSWREWGVQDSWAISPRSCICGHHRLPAAVYTCRSSKCMLGYTPTRCNVHVVLLDVQICRHLLVSLSMHNPKGWQPSISTSSSFTGLTGPCTSLNRLESSFRHSIEVTASTHKSEESRFHCSRALRHVLQTTASGLASGRLKSYIGLNLWISNSVQEPCHIDR